jgi:hypothetical protein
VLVLNATRGNYQRLVFAVLIKKQAKYIIFVQSTSAEENVELFQREDDKEETIRRG